MADGLLLKLDTAAAILAQEKLIVATDKAFVAMGKESAAAASLERQYRTLAAAADLSAQKQVAQASNSTIAQAGLQLRREAELFAASQARQNQQVAASVQTTAAAAQSQQALANGFMLSTRQASQFGGVMQRVLSLTGASGAARGVGLLGGVVRALAGSFNIVGIAVSVAAGFLLKWVSDAVTAESATDKLNEAAKAATESFTNLGEARRQASEDLGAITAATKNVRDLAAENASAAKQAEGLATRLKAIEEAMANIQTQRERQGGDDFLLTIDHVKELLQNVGAAPAAFEALEAASSASVDSVRNGLAGLSSEVRATWNSSSGVGVRASESLRVLGNEAKQAKADLDAMTAASKRAADAENQRAADEIRAQFQRDQEGLDLGAFERQAKARIQAREQEEDVNKRFSDEQKQQILDEARLQDEITRRREAHSEAQAKSTAATAAENKEIEDALQTHQKLAKDLREEVELLQLSATARERRALILEQEAAAMKAFGEVTADDKKAIVEQVDAFLLAKQAAEERLRLEEEVTQSLGGAAEAEEQRLAVMRDLTLDTEFYLELSAEKQEAMLTEIEIQDRLAQVEERRDSAVGQEIEALVRQKRAAAEWRRELEAVKDVGSDVGRELGGALLNAATASGKFSDNLRSNLQDLLQLAANRAVMDLLSRFGSAAASVIFTTTNPPPSQFGSGSQNPFLDNGFGMTGKVLPGSGGEWAQRGTLFDAFQTINRGGRRTNVAEGGPSTPEGLFPLTRDRHGRLALEAPAGGGGTTVFNLPNVRDGASARAVKPTLRQTLEQVERTSMRWKHGSRGR